LIVTSVVFLQLECIASANNATFREICMQNSLNRPQEPITPYSYNEEDVLFRNITDNVQLAGTLTLPKTDGPFPVVILLHGSAPLNRDSAMFDHKLFL